jgi:hypothetical protein
MAGLDDDVHDLAERIKQVEEDIKQAFAGDRSDQHGNFKLGLDVAVGADAKAFTGNDLQIKRRADGLGEPEVTVAIDLQVSG